MGGGVNTRIVVAVVVIGGAGIINAYTATPPRPIERILLGSGIFLIVLSLMDALGGRISEIAGGLALVAMIVAVVSMSPLIDKLSAAVAPKKAG